MQKHPGGHDLLAVLRMLEGQTGLGGAQSGMGPKKDRRTSALPASAKAAGKWRTSSGSDRIRPANSRRPRSSVRHAMTPMTALSFLRTVSRACWGHMAPFQVSLHRRGYHVRGLQRRRQFSAISGCLQQPLRSVFLQGLGGRAADCAA